MNNGFITVAAAIPAVRVADCQYNTDQIIAMAKQAEQQGAEIVCFPELCITGYTCQDLFREQTLLQGAQESLHRICQFTQGREITLIVGLPIEENNRLLNCAAVVRQGEVHGIVPKQFLPNYNEFYEQRWFSAENRPMLFEQDGVRFGIELCEDLWAPEPPSTRLAIAGADLIFNLSASNELIGKNAYLRSLVSQQSARLICGYIYSSAGYGESTQDVVYGGNAMIFENGQLIDSAKRFSYEPQLVVNQIDIHLLRTERRVNTTFTASQRAYEAHKHFNEATLISISTPNSAQKQDISHSSLPTPHSSLKETNFTFKRIIDPLPFIPKNDKMGESCEEIVNIQTAGLARRLDHIKAKTLLIGVSGGLDSTLALLIGVRAFDRLGLDRKGIIGVTMPGFGTTKRTHNNATTLMEALGITSREIDITASVRQHFSDIGHDESQHDVTYENCQARERTQILMDLANKENGIVLGTGDLSEMALGWATYNGDHMSMYAVNGGVPKTLVRYLVSHIANDEPNEQARNTLRDILDTPISPELLPADDKGEIAQKTEDLVGPYELHDFFLYHTLRRAETPQRIIFLAEHAFDGHDPLASRYDRDTICHWLRTFYRRFFSQQFKRSCMPDSPKVGSVSLSPRGDWRMPTDASASLWLASLDSHAS